MAGIAALALAYVFSQFYRSFLAVLTPALTSELGVDAGDLSLASGVWFVTFALMQFAVGVGLDRHGPRRTGGWIFGVAGAGGAFLFAAADSAAGIVAAMAFLGIAGSPVLMASIYLFARRFDAARFAILSSWFVAFGNLGNVIGAAPLAAAVDAFGWRAVMGGLGVANLAVAVAVLALVRDPPRDENAGDAGFGGYATLLRTPALWAVFPMILLCYAPVAGIRGLWTGPWLSDLFGADAALIGRVTLWMALAMVAGSVLYGPLDRWFGTRKWIVLGGNALVLVAIVALALDPRPSLTVASALLVLIGVAGTSYAVLLAHGRAFVPSALVGRGVTLLNFFSITGVGLMQLLTGRIVSAQPDPSALASYRALFATYAVALAVALAIYLFSRDAPPGTALSRRA